MPFKLSDRVQSAVTPALACLALLLGMPASAVPFHGVEFPGGLASFADSVVSYDPSFGGGAVPAAGFQNPSQALGAPNYRRAPIRNMSVWVLEAESF